MGTLYIGNTVISTISKLKVGSSSVQKIYAGSTLLFPSSSVVSPTGSIDTSFNIGTGFGGGFIESLALNSSGSIYAGGSFTTYSGSTQNRLIKLNSNGSQDTSFNIGTGFNNTVWTTVVDSNGKILVGGSFTTYSGSTQNYLVRLNTDGTKDTSFNMGTGFNDVVWAAAIDSNGKILVGGNFTTYSGSSQNYLIRLNSDGTKDTSFNIGSGFTGYTSQRGLVDEIVVNSDGKILVGGNFLTYQGTGSNYLTRINSDGSKDTSFNTSNAFDSWVYTMAVDSNGKIVAGGKFTFFANTGSNHLIRLNSDGTKDTSFNIGSGFNAIVYSIAIDSNGKILAGGSFTTYSGSTQNYLVRLNTDGTKDTSFNIGSGFDSLVSSVVIQPDQKILTGGWFTSYSGSTQNNLVRIT